MCLVTLVYFLGSVTVSVGTISLVISINSANITQIDKCERETVYFLYGWGIVGIILGSIVISLGILESYLFFQRIVEDISLLWIYNLTIGIALGFFFTFGSFVTGFLLFKHCTDKLAYYYWCINSIIFGISVGLLSIAFICSLLYVCTLPSIE